jgi:putative copper resistance protein D
VIGGIVRRQTAVVVRFWERISRWLVWLALPTALISGIAWFALVAISMSGLPASQALQLPTLQLVWSETEFGDVCKLRLVFWFASVLAAAWITWLPAGGRLRSAIIWLAILFGALLLGSLAWAGHGQVGEPARWHLLADAVHLVVAALSPTGLMPLTIFLLCLRRTSEPGKWAVMSLVVNRFSVMSLFSVSALAATGLINSCYMLQSISDFFISLYGRILLVKILLFCLMIGTGAFNLLRLKPRISAIDDGESATTRQYAARLQITIGIELLLGIAVVLAVALLGLIAPPDA